MGHFWRNLSLEGVLVYKWNYFRVNGINSKFPGVLMSSDIYQEIFDSSTIAMIIIQDSVVQLTNNSFNQLYGFQFTSHSALHFQDLMTPTDFWDFFSSDSDLTSTIKNQPIREFHIVNSKNKIFNVLGIFSPIQWNHQPAFLLQILDKTWFQPDLNLYQDYRNENVVAGCSETQTEYQEVTDSLQLDITGRKQAEAQLKHLMQHDTLTDLYNRAYFESELNKRQLGKVLLGIIILDVDGLKLINDTLGHSHGDKLLKAIADLMRVNFREGDILARIGGDEFAVLLTDIDETGIHNLIRHFNAAIYDYNQAHTRVPLNISCGYVLGVGSNFSPGSLFKEADNNMRKEKLFHSQSNRSAIVQTLKKALEARDFITEGHADRLQNLVLKLTTSIGFPENLKNDLRLFAQFHDIGKVGIPDRILFKNGPLSREELLEMRRHPEIGFRIAQSAPELAPIAEWILHHHEWWNGNGYPLGIKGEKIPLACRLLAIVDAFDAMTNDRPYRRSLSFSEALAELRKFAGTQFDPEMVNRFIKVMSN